MRKKIAITSIFLIIILSNICFGYEGKFFSVNVPDSYVEESNVTDSSETIALISVKKDSSIIIESLKGPLFSGKKGIKKFKKNILDNSANYDKLRESVGTNQLLSIEEIQIDGKDAVKMVMKMSDKGYYAYTYRVASNFQTITISMTDSNKKDLDNADYKAVLDSLKIHDSVTDYLPYFLGLIIVIGILFFIIIKLKNKFSNR